MRHAHRVRDTTLIAGAVRIGTLRARSRTPDLHPRARKRTLCGREARPARLHLQSKNGAGGDWLERLAGPHAHPGAGTTGIPQGSQRCVGQGVTVRAAGYRCGRGRVGSDTDRSRYAAGASGMNSVVSGVNSAVTPWALCGACSRGRFSRQNRRLRANVHRCVARGENDSRGGRGV
jgi:hypothetical protein